MNAAALAPVTGLELGLGLIGIGRPWPSPDRPVVPTDAALALLDAAVRGGIRCFDTAPAYGHSEHRLGRFLHGLSADRRAALIVATKCGEHWSPETGSTVDHSLDALRRDVERSLTLLGRIDLLQVHKCVPADLADDRILAWLEQLKADGVVGAVGVSVATPEALRLAVACPVLDAVQFPGNPTHPHLVEAFTERRRDVLPVVNRPMASGALPASFAFHHRALHRGVVLTGTTDPRHLTDNVRAFAAQSHRSEGAQSHRDRDLSAHLSAAPDDRVHRRPGG